MFFITLRRNTLALKKHFLANKIISIPNQLYTTFFSLCATKCYVPVNMFLLAKQQFVIVWCLFSIFSAFSLSAFSASNLNGSVILKHFSCITMMDSDRTANKLYNKNINQLTATNFHESRVDVKKHGPMYSTNILIAFLFPIPKAIYHFSFMLKLPIAHYFCLSFISHV